MLHYYPAPSSIGSLPIGLTTVGAYLICALAVLWSLATGTTSIHYFSFSSSHYLYSSNKTDVTIKTKLRHPHILVASLRFLNLVASL